MTRIWIVQAEHPSVPGTKIAAFASRAGAVDRAVIWTNAVLRTCGLEPSATRRTWKYHWPEGGSGRMWIDKTVLEE